MKNEFTLFSLCFRFVSTMIVMHPVVVGLPKCTAGNYLVSSTVCKPLPANSQIGATENLWNCNSGYTLNVAKTGCSPCGFNQYSPGGASVCFSLTSLANTSAEAFLCAPGQYYAMAAAVPYTLSCVACSASPVGKYYIRDASTSLTAALTAPDKCVTSPCAIPSDAGVYTKGCSGTSPGVPAMCLYGGMPYSAAVGYGYYQRQTGNVSCPVARCTMCNQTQDQNYQNLLCPSPGGGGPGTCTPCAPAANGLIVFNLPTQKCDVICNDGYFFEYTTRRCLACVAPCNVSVGYYKPACAAPVKMSTMQTIIHPATGVVIGASFYMNNLMDPPCVPCNPIQNARPLPSLNDVICQWSCNTGFYLFQDQCLNCTLPSCPVGQYVQAPCLTAPGTVEAPVCRSCTFPANGMRFTPSGPITAMNGCNFTCKAGFWKSSVTCETSSACFLIAGHYFDPGRDECIRCDADTANKEYPYGEPDPCQWFCAKGSYYNATLQGCTYCPRGTYNSKSYEKRPQCIPCPIGKYQPYTGATAGCIALPPNANAIEAASAYQCNGGFILQSSAGCVPCQQTALNMSYVSSVTFIPGTCTIQRFVCAPGYYRSCSPVCNACVACDRVAGATAPDHSTTAAMLSTCQADDQCCERAVACRVEGSCAPGYYELSGAVCASYDIKTCVRCAAVSCASPLINTPCAPSQKSDTCTATCGGANMVRINATTCDCVPGFVSSQLDCVMCPPGTYSRAAACAACAIDTFSAEGGASQCVACPSGTFATSIGSSACAPPSVSSSGACPPGFFLAPWPSGPECQACPEGNYCNGTALSPCPWGTPPAPRLSSIISQCRIAAQAEVCIRSASTVKKCPPNTTNINTRGRSAAWCHPKPGYYGLRGNPATICPVDFFCPSVAVSPIPCPKLRFAVQGSTECIAEMMPPCRDGWYPPSIWAVSAGHCLPCPRGFYCAGNRINACDGGDGPEEASNESACTDLAIFPATCPVNMQRPAGAAVCRPVAGYFYATPSTVAPCPRHYFCPGLTWQAIACPLAANKCGVGETAVAVRCPAGSAQPLDACAPCAPVENAYYTAENSCALSTQCCNAGYYFSYYAFIANSSAACVRSPVDCPVRSQGLVQYYVPEYPACTVGILPCIMCDAMEGVKAIAVVENKCVYTCNAGYVFSRLGCRPCPYGSYLPSDTVCQNCSFGYYTPQYAATACSKCPSGTVGDGGGGCTSCPSGKYYDLENVSTSCQNGFYRPRPWAACQECAAGHRITVAVTEKMFLEDCVACPPGTFSADAACTPCVAYEEYMPYSGATACLRCTLEACGCRQGSCYINGTCLPCAAADAPQLPTCPRLFYFSAELQSCVPCGECAPEADTISVCDGSTTSDVTECKCVAGAGDAYLGFIC